MFNSRYGQGNASAIKVRFLARHQFSIDFRREFLLLNNEAMPPLRDHKRNRAVPILFWSADGAEKHLYGMHERVVSVKSQAQD